ncbi:MAG: thioredoxin domain-containing protein [Patescibacteria group bacterium]
MEPQNIIPPKRDYLLSASILISALLVSVSLVYNAGKKAPESGNAPLTGSVADTIARAPEENIKPVSAADHIFGDPNAPVKIVEFSDLECPFCKQFHYTMKQVVEKYAGKVAWVYRHSPIDQLHPKARKEAEASECAAELGGNTKFWAYVDRLMELTPSNNGLDLALLPKIATDVGLDSAKFNACLSSGKYAEKVASDLADAENSGGGGTPYSIVIAPNGKKTVISGALPFSSTDPRLPAVTQYIDPAVKGL